MKYMGYSLFLVGLMALSTSAQAGILLPEQQSMNLPDIGEAIHEQQTGLSAGDEAATSEQCLAFARDPDADVGEILRAGCEPTLEQMSALMDNPLGNVAMFFNQFDKYRLENPRTGVTADQGMYTGILQFPKRLSKDWNLINRVVFTAPSVPLSQDKIDNFNPPEGPGIPAPGGPSSEPSRGPQLPIDTFSGRTTDWGDTYYVGLFSPYEGIKHDNGATSVWGVGFDVAAPTATEDILGSGKWSAGPAGLYAYLGPKWKLGGLVQHYSSFDGDSDREHVNLTNFQYLYYYSINETTSIGAMPNILIDWSQDKDNRYTVPLGIGINKTFQIGKVPVRVGLEYHHSIVQPDDIVGAEWDVRFYIAPAAPSALFEWMGL